MQITASSQVFLVQVDTAWALVDRDGGRIHVVNEDGARFWQQLPMDVADGHGFARALLTRGLVTVTGDRTPVEESGAGAASGAGDPRIIGSEAVLQVAASMGYDAY
jgi:hypothetical protein